MLIKKVLKMFISTVRIFLILCLFLILIDYLLYVYLIIKDKSNFKSYCPFYRTNFSIYSFVRNTKFNTYNENSKNKHGIVIFGSDYAADIYIDNSDNFATQIANYTKRTVYNRAIAGGGIQHAQIQLDSHFIDDKIKNSDTAIYLLDSLVDNSRSYTYSGPIFQPFWILNKSIYPRYIIEKDNIRFFRTKIPFIRGSIVYRFLEKICKDRGNKRKITSQEINDMYMYFTHLNKSLRQINPDIKFYVVIYHETISDIENIISGKNPFDNTDITLIPVFDLVNVNLNEPVYRKQNNTPTSEAWNIVIPQVCEKMNLN